MPANVSADTRWKKENIDINIEHRMLNELNIRCSMLNIRCSSVEFLFLGPLSLVGEG